MGEGVRAGGPLTDEEPEGGGVDDHQFVGDAQCAEDGRDPAQRQRHVVQVGPPHVRLVRQPAEDDAADRVEDADDGDEERGPALRDALQHRAVRQVDVRHVEADAREEVGDGEEEEEGMAEEGEVHHAAQRLPHAPGARRVLVASHRRHAARVHVGVRAVHVEVTHAAAVEDVFALQWAGGRRPPRRTAMRHAVRALRQQQLARMAPHGGGLAHRVYRRVGQRVRTGVEGRRAVVSVAVDPLDRVHSTQRPATTHHVQTAQHTYQQRNLNNDVNDNYLASTKLKRKMIRNQ